MSLRVCVVYKQERLEMLKFCTGERENIGWNNLIEYSLFLLLLVCATNDKGENGMRRTTFRNLKAPSRAVTERNK
jgi:hypothetical protein